MSKPIGLLDLAWLLVDARLMPMHIGCLQIFDMPANTAVSELQHWHQRLLEQPVAAAPFNLRLCQHGLQRPVWEPDTQVDLEYHVQRWALPAPGDQAALNELVADLHAQPLDLRRPLWEFHLIEGLQSDQFALYIKMHHAIIDGIGGMHLLRSLLQQDPAVLKAAPWSAHSELARPLSQTAAAWQSRPRRLFDWLRGMGHEVAHLRHVCESLSELVWAAMHRQHSNLQAPYTAPPCRLNQRVGRQRVFASQRLRLPAMRQLAGVTGTSINDVLLAVCADALRSMLQREQALPAGQLLAGLPVALRDEDDAHLGTAVSFIVAGLGTDLTDPIERLGHIHASTQAAKQHLASLDAASRSEYTLLMMAPFMSELLSGQAGRARPVFNVIVSNVPGPSQALYFNGARLRAMYPLSIVTHGQGLNITSLGYGDSLHLGLTACPQAVPDAAALAAQIARSFRSMCQQCGIAP